MHRRVWLSRSLRLQLYGLLTVVIGCETVVVDMVEISEVEVLPRTLTLVEGRSDTASAVVRESGGAELPGLSVTWTVDDPRIATIDSGGVVEAQRPGTTRIRAWMEGVSGVATLTVLSDPADGDDEDDDDDDDDDRKGKGRRGRG